MTEFGIHPKSEPVVDERTKAITAYFDWRREYLQAKLTKMQVEQQEYIRFHSDNTIKGRLSRATEGLFAAYRPDNCAGIEVTTRELSSIEQLIQEATNGDFEQTQNYIIGQIKSVIDWINYLRTPNPFDMGTRDLTNDDTDYINRTWEFGFSTLQTIDPIHAERIETELSATIKEPRYARYMEE